MNDCCDGVTVIVIGRLVEIPVFDNAEITPLIVPEAVDGTAIVAEAGTVTPADIELGVENVTVAGDMEEDHVKDVLEFPLLVTLNDIVAL